uniref:Transmembrane protein 138 n=1 Tax=Steinernema glaseri TaxID=37863 RepID=A0A1I8AKX9_9BILA
MSNKFEAVLLLQVSMMLLDIGFNTAEIVLSQHSSILLMLYILQDTNILMTLIVMLISFSSTFVFQAGLISLLLRRFTPTIIVSLLYLALTVAFHIVSLRLDVNKPAGNLWDVGITVLSVLQKLRSFLLLLLQTNVSFALRSPIPSRQCMAAIEDSAFRHDRASRTTIKTLCALSVSVNRNGFQIGETSHSEDVLEDVDVANCPSKNLVLAHLSVHGKRGDHHAKLNNKGCWTQVQLRTLIVPGRKHGSPGCGAFFPGRSVRRQRPTTCQTAW